MSNPLKCPFCGGVPTSSIVRGNPGYTLGRVWIECRPCKIQFSEPSECWEEGVGTYSIEDIARKRVTDRWNTRYTEPGGEK